MNTYKIQQRIKTLSKLDFLDSSGTKINIEGFEIENWKYTISGGPKGDAWIVSKEIEAHNSISAINKFREDFDIIAQKVSFISQCYFDFLGESFLVEKINNNSENIFILRIFNEVEAVPLTFTKELYDSFLILNTIKDLNGSKFFIYMRELNNTIGYYAKLGILCSALESLAGRIEKEKPEGDKFFTYNSKVMKEILGGDYYNKVFGKDGLRHKLLHGDSIDKFYDENYISILYNKILVYLNEKYKLNLDLDIVNPMRHFFGNKTFQTFFMKPKMKELKIDLRSIEKENLNFGKDNLLFTFIPEIKNY